MSTFNTLARHGLSVLVLLPLDDAKIAVEGFELEVGFFAWVLRPDQGLQVVPDDA